MAIDFDVPKHDYAELAQETEACRKDIYRLLRVMKRLNDAVRDGENIGAAIAGEAKALDWAPQTLRKYYDRFRHSGDWRSLINRRDHPDKSQRGQVPVEVVQLFKKLVEQNNRKDEPAYREMMRLYKSGAPVEVVIDGEKRPVIWPELDALRNHPRGCSRRNLQRKLEDFEKVAMREGLGAAMSKYGPKVLTTRVDLWVMSHVMIDDLKRDFKVLMLPSDGRGNGKVACIQELGMLDVFSGDRFMVHRRPQYRRDEDGRKDSLKEKELRYLLGAWARNVGYSPRGTELISELGTAVVRDELAKWFHKFSDGKITRREPGILGREQVIAGYFGTGGGNPRHKPHLESNHNLQHNEAANLPAATGHDRNPPEWLHGLEAVTEQVIKWIAELPAERALLLRPLMAEYWQALDLLADIDLRIATRTDHQLEGWGELRHTHVEYLQDAVNEIWIGREQLLTLPQRTQEMLMQAADAYPAYRRVRNLCPREVLVKGMSELVRFPDPVIALMFIDRDLGDDLRQKRRLNADGKFEITDSEVHAETMFFSREVRTPDGGMLRLDSKHDYQVVLNPYDPTALWVYGDGGQVLGTAERIQRASRIETDGPRSINHALGQRSHELAQILTPLRDRHSDTERLIKEIEQHNEAVRRGEAVTDDEKALQRRQAKRVVPIEEFRPEPVEDESARTGSVQILSPEDFLNH